MCVAWRVRRQADVEALEVARQPISSAYVITRYITASVVPALRYACGVSASNRIESPASRRCVSPRDVDLDGARGDDEVLAGAGRVRVGILDGAGGEAQLVELDAARLVEREQRARAEAAVLADVRIFDSAERSTSAPDCVRALISAENVTSSARAIFHSTLIVGALLAELDLAEHRARHAGDLREPLEREAATRAQPAQVRADDRREIGRLRRAPQRAAPRTTSSVRADAFSRAGMPRWCDAFFFFTRPKPGPSIPTRQARVGSSARTGGAAASSACRPRVRRYSSRLTMLLAAAALLMDRTISIITDTVNLFLRMNCQHP